ENIDWALGDPDSHIPDFGTIEVEVLRIKLKRNVPQSEQPPSAAAMTPRKVVDLSGQEITEVYFTNTLWRKKRSAPPIFNSLGFVYGSDEKMEPARLSFLYRHGLTYQLEALGRVHPVAAETPSAPATNSEKYMYTSKDFKILAEKVDRLEEQLKESQQQTAALMEKLVGGIHSTIQTALARPPTGSVSTPAHNSGVKRKRNTDEITPSEVSGVGEQINSTKGYRRSLRVEQAWGKKLLNSGRRTSDPIQYTDSNPATSQGKEHAKEVPELLGTTENELGIRKWLEGQGHSLVTTSDKEGENSTFDKELVDAEVIITTPFHPGYLTAERLAKAKNLKLAITAGIGSDHVDLDAANKTNGGITVAEVTGSNVVSVAEHVIMTILVLVRNFVPAHEQVAGGDWNVAAVAKGEYDLENKVVGTVAVGRIGERVLRRLKAFDCKELLYFDYQPLKPELEKEIGCRRVENLEEMLAQCDVVTINCPLHEKTRGMFNKELISKMKKGSWLVNTARGAIVVKEDVAEALKSGHLRGYGGDVWFPQPAPKEHPLRYATNTQGGGNAMVPHMSGTSLDAQK
ncbi:MAG: hypothetical protein Q9204_007467, partial [Flavoplaca sp. TL-2023a]